ncbi:hypothetical protein EHP00_2274 [Ecytonucleospora hepatopenaei]|uniref:Uncharacterized protein n=1 Tax=Ecytonucleospora hepatopenaei TaxID=646526 RepID=A0A1W0E3L0_9MICR|nr:hypothetical protein EHP00_2274 [Ecytonucleospora hepatopenaei]
MFIIFYLYNYIYSNNITNILYNNINFLINSKYYNYCNYINNINNTLYDSIFDNNTLFTIYSGELIVMTQIVSNKNTILYNDKIYNFFDELQYTIQIDNNSNLDDNSNLYDDNSNLYDDNSNLYDDNSNLYDNNIIHSFYVDNYFILNKGAIIKVKDNLSNKEYNYNLLHNVFIDIKGKTDLLVINKDTELRSNRNNYFNNYFYTSYIENDQNLKYYACFSEKNDKENQTIMSKLEVRENEELKIFKTSNVNNDKDNLFIMKILNTKVNLEKDLIFNNCKNYINFKYNDNNQLEDYKIGDKINFDNLKLRNILFCKIPIEIYLDLIFKNENSSRETYDLCKSVNVYLKNTKSVMAKSLQPFETELYNEIVLEDLDEAIKDRKEKKIREKEKREQEQLKRIEKERLEGEKIKKENEKELKKFYKEMLLQRKKNEQECEFLKNKFRKEQEYKILVNKIKKEQENIEKEREAINKLKKGKEMKEKEREEMFNMMDSLKGKGQKDKKEVKEIVEEKKEAESKNKNIVKYIIISVVIIIVVIFISIIIYKKYKKNN